MKVISFPRLVRRYRAVIPFSNNVRTNLNVCAVGPRGWGKTRTFQRIRDSFVYSVPTQIIQKYPGSEIGLVELLGGKKSKDEEELDMIPKPFLLYQDELRSTFAKVGVENSALPYMINHLFSKDEYGTASKRGTTCAIPG